MCASNGVMNEWHTPKLEEVRYFKEKKQEYLRDSINEHKANRNNHSITDIHKEK